MAKPTPTDGVLFVGLSCVAGVACRHLLRGTRVPYTVALLLLGLAIGSLEFGARMPLGALGNAIRLWADIDPDLLLAVFLPPLLFEGSFSMDSHQIKKCMVQMLLLAGPGVIISTFCIGCALKLTFPYEWSWQTSLLLGAILSATDPVAVVASLKELGTSKKLSTIIEGESMVNDGASVVVYQLFYKMVLGWHFQWADIFKFLTEATVGALGLGIAFGIVSVYLLGFMHNDPEINLALTLSVSYLSYFTAQEVADSSGILTVVTLGMVIAAVARTTFKGNCRQSLHNFWEGTAYIANTLIFILSGVIMAKGFLCSDNSAKTGSSWGYLFLLYVFTQVARAIVVVTLYPLIQYFGYGLSWKEAVVVFWSGLRGAVALSMALSIKDASGATPYISSETGNLFLFLTAGTVFLTLVVNGSTAQFLLSFFGMDELSQMEKLTLDYTKYKMMDVALEARENLQNDDLGPFDWLAVKSYMMSLNNMELEGVHPHSVSTSSSNLAQINLQATRVCFLRGAQAVYKRMLDDGWLTQITAYFLMGSVDDAMDSVSREPLCDWKCLKVQIDFRNDYKCFGIGIFPQKLVNYLTIEKLKFAYYTCSAFLQAHKIARRKIREYMGESNVIADVISESEAEEKEARKLLEDIVLAFPEVLRIVRTSQVTYSLLNDLEDYIQNLGRDGVLDDKLSLHLHELVQNSVLCWQSDYKKLLRSPPRIKVPRARAVISQHPCLRSLPYEVRQALENSVKETVKPQGLVLSEKGCLPRSLFLIANGLVKSEVRCPNSPHGLYTTFPQGCIMGLYELLSGNTSFCDLTSDTVVLCYVIEVKVLLPLVRLIPEVKNILWQECIIVLAKLMLTQEFEKTSIPDLRTLFLERSSIITYIAGEAVEIWNESIGFLLEGLLRTPDLPSVAVESPAALLPSQESPNSSTPEAPGSTMSGFRHYGSRYQVEQMATVARVDLSGRCF
ncbi:sodium/hydrogen exchanger 8-like isoform X1 [Syzygium oleosum]|uniref:sodium/hydrogen exchanger 8-like isoform X1 n=1 Tax=Syzygium oleosum TaxID=219896 RepID=UPI0024BA2A6B|nr:sodium/hydrogen exchanger 8-like isoform X1 [Syzygium oleosum]